MAKSVTYMQISHPFAPCYAPDARVLILGSFPSVRSREEGFYYGHPQNRFWRVLSRLFAENMPSAIEDKKDFLYTHRIALWDCIAACTLTGSDDASIRDAIPNDLSGLLQKTQITRVFCNGKTAYRLYNRYIYPQIGIEAVPLPSTSPANAAWSEGRLLSAWQEIVLPAVFKAELSVNGFNPIGNPKKE